MWCRDLIVLNRKVRLSPINMEEHGHQPRFILLRQVLWGVNCSPGDYIHEASFTGTIASPVLEPKWVAKNAAITYPQYRWTLVELGWYEDDRAAGNPPHIFDVIVYEPDGSFIDSMEREREARKKMAAS